jgi:thiol:disulfide interchange protein DsbA
MSAKSRKQKEAQVKRIRMAIIGAIAVVAVLVVGYGLLYSTGVTQGEFVEGEHYQLLDNPLERRRPGEPVSVREFFSYACIHCKNFDPVLEEWLAGTGDEVAFSRVPVAFSPQWVLLAQIYLTLEQMDILAENHTRVFRRIHDRRSMFASPEEAAEFVDGNGTTAEDFLTAFSSSPVRRKLNEADSLQRSAGISAVPTLLVAGKYVVTMDVGPRVALEVVDHLVALENGTLEVPAEP